MTISRGSIVNVDGGVVFASVALVPRLLRDEWFFAPQLALWFVGLLAQYYLLFPLLFVLMRRIGVLPFLLLTFAITVGANWWDRQPLRRARVQVLAGDGLGAVPAVRIHVRHGDRLAARVAGAARVRSRSCGTRPCSSRRIVAGAGGAHRRRPADRAAGTVPLLAVAGAAAGDAGARAAGAAAAREAPVRVDVAMPVRALATIGVMSYAILSSATRCGSSRARSASRARATPLWWTFLVAVYVPVTLLLAWPLARVLGLMPKRDGQAQPARAREVAPSGMPEIALGDAVGAGGR